MQTSNGILLSLLTPAVPSRLAQLENLCAEVARQTGDLPVEHLALLDNRRRTIGEKRDALLRAARGKYVAFCDDDDEILPGYIFEIFKKGGENPDVITFRQESIVNGQRAEIHFGLGNPNEPYVPGGIVRRNAWHVCAWRRSLAMLSHFPASNYGEDWAYAAPLCALPGLREAHIPQILHRYRHDEKTTLAPLPAV